MTTTNTAKPSRRALLGTGAVAALGGVAAGFGTAKYGAQAVTTTETGPAYQPFHGTYQAGILQPAPAHAAFVTWDLQWRDGAEGSRADQLRSVLKLISDDALRLMSGRGVLADTEPEMAQQPSDLTLTVGLGPDLVEVAGAGQFATLPAFAGDQLQERYGQGDLLIQFCSQDPTVLAHAVRAVSKDLRTLATRKSTQLGFLHATPGDTFRNLFGQLDGVNNPTDQARQEAVFGTEQARSWIEHGTTLALRRFELDLDGWDELDVSGRDYALGRRQSDGAPLSGDSVDDPVDLSAENELGLPVIAANAHVALARPTSGDEVMFRRGYNFAEADASGLLFACYQRDPQTSFIPVQHRLAAADALNTWITPVGSALYAVLPGVSEGMYLGQQLLEG